MNGQTDERTLVVVESLSRLKTSCLWKVCSGWQDCWFSDGNLILCDVMCERWSWRLVSSPLYVCILVQTNATHVYAWLSHLDYNIPQWDNIQYLWYEQSAHIEFWLKITTVTFEQNYRYRYRYWKLSSCTYHSKLQMYFVYKLTVTEL